MLEYWFIVPASRGNSASRTEVRPATQQPPVYFALSAQGNMKSLEGMVKTKMKPEQITEPTPPLLLGSTYMNLIRTLSLLLIVLFLAGCASRPINPPITQVDPQAGYRPHLLIPKRQNNDPHTLFVLSFSGGGTRAAAFSYGVLEELRRTEIVVDGHHRRLIDEVDTITGVSGGSFTALA